MSGREITFLPTYAFISWGPTNYAKRPETPRFLSHCDVAEGVASRHVASRSVASPEFLVSRSTDRDLPEVLSSRRLRHVSQVSIIAEIRCTPYSPEASLSLSDSLLPRGDFRPLDRALL